MLEKKIDKLFCCKNVWSLFAIMMLMTGCATNMFNPDTVEREPQEDVVLAMKIKSKFIQSDELSAAAIHVEASGSVVELTGFVETVAQKKLAGEIAQQTIGVSQVKNLIKVK